ncbi:hypothetical protein THAOC_26669, partial [Thalassiosira oceanica]
LVLLLTSAMMSLNGLAQTLHKRHNLQKEALIPGSQNMTCNILPPTVVCLDKKCLVCNSHRPQSEVCITDGDDYPSLECVQTREDLQLSAMRFTPRKYKVQISWLACAWFQGGADGIESI